MAGHTHNSQQATLPTSIIILSRDILPTDAMTTFAHLDLHEHLTPRCSNGFRSESTHPGRRERHARRGGVI
jgi:hypothetical protein